MLQISQEIYSHFNLLMANRNVPPAKRDNYKKWLRYYLDFCKKYRFDESKNESLSPFINKLQEKHQSTDQQDQASHAVNLYNPSNLNDLNSSVKENNPDYDKRLPNKDKPSIKQNEPSRSVQVGNLKEQSNSDNLKEPDN